MKYIQKTNKRNQSQASGKELVIPIGNHVLLRDHPEGWNKIQNKFKSDVYEVVDHHKEPNVYYIKRLDADKYTQPKVVNRHQLFDLKRSVPPSVNRNSVDDLASVPSYLHNNSKSNFGFSSDVDSDSDSTINLDSAKGTASHHYNTRARHKATAPVRPVVACKRLLHVYKLLFHKVETISLILFPMLSTLLYCVPNQLVHIDFQFDLYIFIETAIIIVSPRSPVVRWFKGIGVLSGVQSSSRDRPMCLMGDEYLVHISGEINSTLLIWFIPV